MPEVVQNIAPNLTKHYLPQGKGNILLKGTSDYPQPAHNQRISETNLADQTGLH